LLNLLDKLNLLIILMLKVTRVILQHMCVFVLLLGWRTGEDGNGEDVALRRSVRRLRYFRQEIFIIFYPVTASCIP